MTVSPGCTQFLRIHSFFITKVLYHLNSIPRISHHNFLTIKILVYTLHQVDLTGIYRPFHPTTCSHGTYSRIGHIIKHKYVLVNLRRSKSYQLSGNNDIELEINKSLSGKIYKNVETKQYTSKKSMGQKRNQK